jgi:hypothetical protein
MPRMPEYSDKNLNATLPLGGHNPPGYTDRTASPAKLATPKAPALPSAPIQHPENAPQAQQFRKLANLLNGQKEENDDAEYPKKTRQFSTPTI